MVGPSGGSGREALEGTAQRRRRGEVGRAEPER